MNAQVQDVPMQYARRMCPESLEKLEKFLIDGANKAIAQGKTIICNVWHPTEDSCCPIYAACMEARDKARHRLDVGIPQYEEVISAHIGEEFNSTDLRAFFDGYDTNHPFMHYSFYLHPHRNENLFNLGRRLRRKYIEDKLSLLPDYVENATSVACISDYEAKEYTKTLELPNVLFGHINFCIGCRQKLEQAIERKKEDEALSQKEDKCFGPVTATSFVEAKEITSAAINHLDNCQGCRELLYNTASETISDDLCKWETVQVLSFKDFLRNKFIQFKNWFLRLFKQQ